MPQICRHRHIHAMHTCTYIHANIYTYTYVHTYMHIHMHTCTVTHIQTHMHTHPCLYIHTTTKEQKTERTEPPCRNYSLILLAPLHSENFPERHKMPQAHSLWVKLCTTVKGTIWGTWEPRWLLSGLKNVEQRRRVVGRKGSLAPLCSELESICCSNVSHNSK